MKFLILAFALLPGLMRAASPDLVNGIAVLVGDAVITYKDVQLSMEEDLDLLERRYGGQPRVYAQKANELERAKLEDMVENQLVLQEFKKSRLRCAGKLFSGTH